MKDRNNADNGFSTRKVSTIDNSSIIYSLKTKFGDQIVDLQGLKDCYPHLKKLPNQSCNLNKFHVIRGRNCYDIHHPLEFKNSADKIAPWAGKLKKAWALTGPLPVKQAATLVTTGTSVSEDKLVIQLGKWWDIDSYSSNSDDTGHF